MRVLASPRVGESWAQGRGQDEVQQKVLEVDFCIVDFLCFIVRFIVAFCKFIRRFANFTLNDILLMSCIFKNKMFSSMLYSR